MRKMILSFIAAAVLVVGAPLAASAVDQPPGATDSAGTGDTAATGDDALGYTPRTPQQPTLAGTTVAPSCSADAPWIEYSVLLVDPQNLSTDHTATLVLSDGTHSTTLTLGTVTAGVPLTGRVLWPGASVGADGRGNGWPGWAYVGGQWTASDDNFGWTRGAITATVEVNPSLAVALSYPPSSPACRTAPAEIRAAAAGAALPATGGDIALAAGVGVAGAGLIAMGGALVVRRRRS
ncbi:LPXTG cell wall anchor domain-containing protein [Microbacterium aurum]|jgi:LPXTG-motif cell wall-anchored protein|uniref:LPXTG cell wall anchor domain-containing protein n=1 Tax=Microbacterium aurum TaxID=36805 RepID=UPI00248E94CE|nr:LPXTG cell wall anchor domain-containing protein [Microbacterium aurum]